MKKISLAALLISAVVTVPAFANDNGPTPKTRAEVKAELMQARASGVLSVNPNSTAYEQELPTGGYAVPRVQYGTQLSQGAAKGVSVEN
ncbi:DUF4148 domain-containing protein [Paraburkholderia sp.]|uniref:DUF4148 domain-containing protein n=1 Tax=Paraburkholderia sp. TaxID=1926495 RepID=UPI003D6F1DAD